MEILNNLGIDISATGNAARYDAACKRILSDKHILAHIMKACVSEYECCSIEDIAQKYIEKDIIPGSIGVLTDTTNSAVVTGRNAEDATRTEGIIRYDVCFNAKTPGDNRELSLIINVEAQNNYQPGYPLIKRAIYYASRLISAQKERDWFKSEYDKIRKVYSIWICLNPPTEHEDYINAYEFREIQEHGSVTLEKEHYDLIEVVMIGLSQKDTSHGLVELLSAVFSKNLSIEDKRSVLEKHKIPFANIETEVQEMCNFSKGIYDDGRLKGKIETILELMTAQDISAEAACDMLRYSAEVKEKIVRLIEANR